MMVNLKVSREGIWKGLEGRTLQLNCNLKNKIKKDIHLPKPLFLVCLLPGSLLSPIPHPFLSEDTLTTFKLWGKYVFWLLLAMEGNSRQNVLGDGQ